MIGQTIKKNFVVDISAVNKNMIEIVGGKGANLGELVSIGIRVPPGFIITSDAFKYFFEYNNLNEKIIRILNEEKDIEKVSDKIRELIINSKIPLDLEEQILDKYEELRNLAGKDILVAVRSSATAEDIQEASFAGQQDTYLNVSKENLLEYIKKVWSSLYTTRAIAYRSAKGIDHTKVAMAVVVQKMVNSKSAGVMFTLHPANGDTNLIVIESSWGLGEAVVAGKVTPDEVVIDKKTLKIIEKKISNKKLKIVYDQIDRKNKIIETSREEAETHSLKDEEAIELAKLALKIEEHYKIPMDIEWAIDQDLRYPDNIFIVQARPETFWSTKKKEERSEVQKISSQRKVLVKGLPASPGISFGKAKVLLDMKEAKEFNKGDILVTKMTDPDWVPIMKIASAIITDEGGMTSHAAIVSRELGIPAIVGTGNATQIISSNQEITVDAFRGIVYEGRADVFTEIKEEARAQTVTSGVSGLSREVMLNIFPVTATKIYMNLGQPDVINKYLDLPFDGIGLMRIEFIVSEWIRYHPLYLIKIGKPNEFVDKLAEGISIVASAIYPRPIVVRFSDFKSNEYKRLESGEEFEPEERNPMIGWRGVSRYINPRYEPAFRLEVRAIKKVREEMGLRNVWVMLPFVRTTWEIKRVINIMEEEGLRKGSDFKIWIMAEVPSIVLLADEFAKLVDGFSIGSNDLAQLTLGVDRDSELLANMGYYDERDPAVLKSMKILIRAAHKHGATVSICGQAPSVYPEVVEFLVREGIDSISVNPDAVIQTRRLVASIEQKLMLENSINSKKKSKSIKL